MRIKQRSAAPDDLAFLSRIITFFSESNNSGYWVYSWNPLHAIFVCIAELFDVSSLLVEHCQMQQHNECDSNKNARPILGHEG